MLICLSQKDRILRWGGGFALLRQSQHIADFSEIDLVPVGAMVKQRSTRMGKRAGDPDTLRATEQIRVLVMEKRI